MRYKIIILVLSHFEEPYKKLEQNIRETWASHSNDLVKVLFYHGANRDSGFEDIIEGDKIILNTKEGLENIGYKTIRAFEKVLSSYEFDYVFRTNSSSYVNINKLLEYVSDKPLESFYHGVIGYSEGNKFASGSGYFLSKDLVELVVKNKEQWPHSYIDDVAISLLLKKFNILPTLAPRLDITHLPLTDEINNHYHFRCKTFGDRSGDIEIMRQLHHRFVN